MTVVDVPKVLSSDNLHIEDTHGPCHIVTMDPPGLLESLFRLFQSLVVGENVLLDLMLALDQLVLGRDVLPSELREVYMPVLILIQLLVDLIDDLTAMLIIDALLGQEHVHLVAIDPSIAVPIQLAKCLPQTNLFIRALLLLSVHVQLLLISQMTCCFSR